MAESLHTIPTELVDCVLDNLDNKTIFVSLSNVCTRLNSILNKYYRYRVIWSSSKHCSFLIFIKTLTILDFGQSNIGDDRVQYIAQALYNNTVRLNFFWSVVIDQYRHWSLSILGGTTSVTKEHNILLKHCTTTQ